MGAIITHEGDLFVVRLTGMLRKAEVDSIQWGGINDTSPEDQVNVLIIAESFEGWKRGDPWGDVSFVATYGDRIRRMALVAQPEWETRLLMFTGAGFRRTEIKFFPLDQLAAARAWLAEPTAAAPKPGGNAD